MRLGIGHLLRHSNVYLWTTNFIHKPLILFIRCLFSVQHWPWHYDIAVLLYLMNNISGFHSLHKYTLLWVANASSKCPMPNLISSGSCILLVIHSWLYLYHHLPQERARFSLFSGADPKYSCLHRPWKILHNTKSLTTLPQNHHTM